ncbi:hypothetical protein soil367_11935 [Hydrocarboniclastica marina]|uniref:Uncharacterized protein n=1 Tax=Hydrocarboniclastica marina TaxID=2259620 RepID=A0A4P7XJ47_9ALTE|nr:hypothetical protein soil367_11935 [Hydrocarboniclastica marina]
MGIQAGNVTRSGFSRQRCSFSGALPGCGATDKVAAFRQAAIFEQLSLAFTPKSLRRIPVEALPFASCYG